MRFANASETVRNCILVEFTSSVVVFFAVVWYLNWRDKRHRRK